MNTNIIFERGFRKTMKEEFEKNSVAAHNFRFVYIILFHQKDYNFHEYYVFFNALLQTFFLP